MAISFYMDHNVPKAISVSLRLRNVDVITAWEDGGSELPDDRLLDRAYEINRVLFTHDDDFLAEAARRRQSGASFASVVFARQHQLSVGKIVEDLETIAKAGDLEDLKNCVIFLPL